MEIAQSPGLNPVDTAAGIRHHTAKPACCQLTSYDILPTVPRWEGSQRQSMI